jgi:hypothetical protein
VKRICAHTAGHHKVCDGSLGIAGVGIVRTSRGDFAIVFSSNTGGIVVAHGITGAWPTNEDEDDAEAQAEKN